jgi:hypothetical protein
MAEDGVHGEPPGDEEQEGTAGWEPPPKHVASERAVTRSLRTAHAIGEALGDADQPVVVDTRGPHRSIAAIDRLLAEALEHDAEKDVGDDPSEHDGSPGSEGG